MAKRSYGEGSVYPTSDGKGWMADLSMMLPNGKRKRIRRRAKNKTEANRLLRSLRDELHQKGSVPSQQRDVATAVAEYLEFRHAADLQPQTLEKDHRHAEIIALGLGRQRVATLSVDDCDSFLRSAAEGAFGRPYGRPELRRLRQKLIRILENDERRGLVNRNVARLSVVPEESPDRKPRRAPRAISLSEIEDLILVAPQPVSVFIDLVGRNGLRPAEARGLQWTQVDVTASTVQIIAQMNRSNELAKVKTRRSHRTIRFDDVTANRLLAWRESQSAFKESARVAWSGNALNLIITTRFGTAVNQRNLHRSIVASCGRAMIDPPIGAYDLRHSAITLQVERGHPVHRIADWAGTSERMIADVYRHKLDVVTDLTGP